MTFRPVFLSTLALGVLLSAPFASAQNGKTNAVAPDKAASAQPATPASPATPATPPASQGAGTASATPATAATPATPAEPARASAPRRITWSDLDADKDGKLTKSEAAPVQALTQVFDTADADKDGALTPDEYKAYLASSGKSAGNQG